MGTPYVHQHRTLGVGVDCIGLIWAVGEAVGVLSVDPAKVKRFLGYTRMPNPRRMREALETFFVPVTAEYEPGDVAWLAWDRDHAVPQHTAILGEHRQRPTLIHAFAPAGKCVEHGFTGEWPQLVTSWWRYPGLV